jgi:acyl carrier protein
MRLPEPSAPPTHAAIEAWLRDVIAELTGLAPETVDVRVKLTRFGVDSATALIITDMLIEWLGIDLDPTLLYEHDTIEALAGYLAGRVQAEAK